MNLFCKTPAYSVCQECGVHYEPVTGPFNEYCLLHRMPRIEMANKIARVKAYAERHLEELLPKVIEEEKAHQELLSALYDHHNKNIGLAGLAAAQASHFTPQSLGALGAMFGGNPRI